MTGQGANVSAPHDFSHLGVDVHFTRLTLPTYLRGPDDPNPPLFGKGTRAIYPYRWKRSFTTSVEPREYDAIVVSSPWIEATVLPDWGMHLYRAVDRLTGRDLFHCPQVMKPAHNARRGEYIGGGVEMNFPWGHTVATTDRTHVIVHRTDEGVSVLFRQHDRQAQTQLVAGVTVRADLRGVLFDASMFNASALPRPWYYWLNAGIAPHPSLRFIFPTTSMLGHFEGPFLETVRKYAYPVHDGVDYSRYVEQPEPLGLFNPGSSAGWFGAWYDDWNFGVARWAAPWRVSGQKFWFWGNSEEGRLWGRIADDASWSIPEIQSGRPETQMDRGVLPPYGVQTHREWWMPVSGIGGFGGASRFGAINVVGKGRECRISISAATGIAASDVMVNGVATARTPLLAPGTAHQINLPCPLEHLRDVRLVNDRCGEVLAWQAVPDAVATTRATITEDLTPMSQAGAGRWAARGARWDRNGQADIAEQCHEQAIKVDSECGLAHRQVGLQRLHARDSGGARASLAVAVRCDRRDEEALYLHALACLWSGDEAQAVADLCAVAATGAVYVLPAIMQLAVLAMRRGQRDRARMLVQDGLSIQPNHPALLWLSAVQARLESRPPDFDRAVAAMDAAMTGSIWCAVERRLAGASDTALHVSGDDDSEDAILIHAACWYADIGQVDSARQLLEGARSDAGRTEAAYLLRLWGCSWAENQPRTWFFAWTREAHTALAQSLRRDGDDAVAHFAIGCLLAETGSLDTAIEHLWHAHRLSGDSLPSVTLGRVMLAAGDIAGAVPVLNEATSRLPVNADAWIELDRALARTSGRDLAWLCRFTSAPLEVLADERAREAMARLAMDVGELDMAAAILADGVFHPYELTHDLRNLWSAIHRRRALRHLRDGHRARVMDDLAQALSYPANLQLGRPLRTFDAGTLYFAGRLMEQLGDQSGARGYFERAAQEFQPDPTVVKPWSIVATVRCGWIDVAQRCWQQFVDDATARIESGLHPDQQTLLRRGLDLATRLRSGWEPTLDELPALLE